jgi:hypothetical protein
MSRTRTRKQNEKIENRDEITTRVITHEDIARRSYTIYENRNREDGHDLDDWLQAERELRKITSVQHAFVAY